MTTLTAIESKTVTSQQEKGFAEYSKLINESNSEPSEHGFQDFYSKWCFENNLFNDINQSDFDSEEERWDI